MIILIDGVKYILKNPNSEDDLEKIVEKNYKYIFGDNSFYFNFKRKVKSKSGIVSIPDGYLIIFNNIPQWYILEVELASHPLYDHIIPQLTKFNRAIEEISTKKSLIDMFYDEIKKDLVLEANIKNKIGSGEIYKFISDLISVKPKIIIIINEKTNELNEVTRDIRGDIKILEFKIFRREFISEEVEAYLFNPIIDFKNIEKPIIPKPEEGGKSVRSPFSLEKSNLVDTELEKKLLNTLERKSDLTPRVIGFLEIISSEERIFKREEIRSKLFEKGIGVDIGQSGRYLSNISQFLTKKSNPHLRQIIEFETGGLQGETKNKYKVISQYRSLLKSVLEKVRSNVNKEEQK